MSQSLADSQGPLDFHGHNIWFVCKVAPKHKINQEIDVHNFLYIVLRWEILENTYYMYKLL